MNDQTNNLISLEAEVTEDAKEQLDAIGKWSVYSAVIGFTSLGLTIISTVATLNKVSEYGAGMGAGAGLFQTFFITALSLLLNITLYTAGNNIRKGVLNADQGFFNAGLQKLNNYFKILGILLIIVLSIFLLAFVFGGMMSLFR